MLSKIEEKRKARIAAQQNVSDERERLKETYQENMNSQRRAKEALSKEKKEQKKEKTAASWLILLVVAIMLGPTIIGGFLSVFMLSLNAPIMCGIASAVLFIIAFFSVKKARQNITLMKAPKKFPASVFSLISILVIVIISFWDPASDYIYYGAVILAMIGIIANIVDMILSYNYIAMRPLPQFEMYKGGDDRGF
jgi:cation transport ATPase